MTTVETIRISAPADLFKQAAIFAYVASDPDSSRYALGGILIEFTSEGLRLIGCDGQRLHIATIPKYRCSNLPEEKLAILLGGDTTKKLLRCKKTGSVSVDVRGYGDFIIYHETPKTGEAEICSQRSVGGVFPKFEQVIPTSDSINEVRGTVKEFREWMNLVNNPTPQYLWGGKKEEKYLPSIQFEMRGLVGGDASMPRLYVDEPDVVMSFNPKFIESVLHLFASEMRCTLRAFQGGTYQMDLGDNFQIVFQGFTRKKK